MNLVVKPLRRTIKKVPGKESPRYRLAMKEMYMDEKKSSVGKRLALSLLLLFGLCAATILVSSSVMLTNGLLSYYRDEFAANITLLQDNFAESQQELRNALKWLDEESATANIIVSGDREEAIRKARFIVTSGQADQLVFFNEAGINIATGEPAEPAEQVALVLRGQGIADKIITENRFAFVSGVPITVKGRLVGGIIALRDGATLDAMQTYKATLNSEVSYFYGTTRVMTTITDKAGKRIVGTKLEDTDVVSAVVDRGAEHLGTGTIDGKQYLTLYIPLKDRYGKTKGMFFIGKPTDRILVVAGHLYRVQVLLFFVTGILLLVIGGLIVRHIILKPLAEIGGAVHNLASGHADLTQRIGSRRGDEFGGIASDINTFMDILRSLLVEVKDAQTALVSVVNELGANAAESASATTQIMTNIDGARKQSSLQDESIRNVNGVLANAAMTVTNLDSLIQNQSSGIVESSAAIEEMVSNIGAVSASVGKLSAGYKDLMAASVSGKAKQEAVDERVRGIVEQSRILMEANVTIAKIAAQTNLLAMNAAIEAAHAGEAGAGFAVVADEIRRLAENSSARSKEINGELRKIAVSIESVVASSRESQDAFSVVVSDIEETERLVAEIDSAMEEQRNASRQVLEALRDMNSSAMSVQEQSTALRNGVSTVTGEMGSLSGKAQAVLGSMDEMSSGAHEISATSRDISEMATKTRDAVHLMDEYLDKFTL
jgi:methyl-accepting chemotaxis protein